MHAIRDKNKKGMTFASRHRSTNLKATRDLHAH
jgi:hypothetical protein